MQSTAPDHSRGAHQSERRRWVLPTLLITLATLILLLWRAWYVPKQAAQYYTAGYQSYVAGNYQDARDHLERTLKLAPEMLEAQTLLGWSYWRVGHLEQAEAAFRAAHQAYPTSFEPKSALSMVLLALNRVEDALPLLEEISRLRPADAETRLRLADAYRRTGRNRVAVAVYREMLQSDPSEYRAEQALLNMFGYTSLGPDVSFSLPPRTRPAELQLHFRTQGDYFQAFDDGRWRDVYLTGANLGPGRPGEWAVAASLTFDTYREWLQQIAEAGGNTVRVYTILPPAFYRALEAHNLTAEQPLWFIQEVWLADQAMNLYEPTTVRDFERELRNAIDLLHGQADIGCKSGHYCGIYTADVSHWVIGIGVGREVEPRMVRATDRLNPEKTSYRGTFVSLEEGTPAQVWFAEMCDLAARYETETYNAQRPLTIVNWPPLDPMQHPTEATYEEEVRIRKSFGEEEVYDSIPDDMNDMDVVTIHIPTFSTEPSFQAGLFALYHVYQHWPDFLFLEPRYALASDEEGPNRYLGYLEHLKSEHVNFPLVIGEYGVSTSQNPAHLHPDGWHNGGISEQQQAELLTRFTKNIRDTRMAGGIVFAWLDEWWKQVHDEFTAPLEPRPNDPLWLNVLDPEESFGIVGFRPFDAVPLLRGSEADWAGAQPLYGPDTSSATTGETAPPVRGVYATSDYAYLYLRLDLDTLAQRNWDDSRLRIALNTVPGEAGSTVLPGGGPRTPSGTNFLVEVDALAEARILIAHNYNPWEHRPAPGRPDMMRSYWKVGMPIALDTVPFEALVVEVNQPRWARDGREFPPLTFSHDTLHYGTADPELPGYTSRALWHVDRARGMVEIRIPWLFLLITDPVQRLVFGGTDAEKKIQMRTTPGVSVSVLTFAARAADAQNGDGAFTLIDALPEVSDGAIQGTPSLYTWEPWTRVRYTPYLKPSFYALQALWRSWPRFLN